MRTDNAVLHSHSEFSVRDSLIRIEDLPKIAANNGWGVCAITDHGAIEGVPRFKEAAGKAGIKPVIGCELYIGATDEDHIQDEAQFDKLHHLTILCKNANGFKSLTRIMSYAHKHHYIPKKQKAAAPLELVMDELKDCVVLSGCYSSPFWRGSMKAADDLVKFAGKFKDDFFLEVMGLHDWDKQVELNRTIYEISNQLNLPLVVTPDCHFDSEHDHVFHKALLAVASRKSVHDPKAWKFSTNLNYLTTPDQTTRALARSGIPELAAIRALENTQRVGERIKNWSWDELPKPEIPTVAGNMREIALAGLERHGKSSDPTYRDRLELELKTFADAGLDRYLLLVRHCVDLFKREGAEIGPRGSVGGSLVAYTMGITPIDPIQHGLSYERFFFPGRKGWPDVDLDLDKATRSKAGEILAREFGQDHVAQVSNYATFGLRMAIKDAARAYGIKLDDQSIGGPEEKDFESITDVPPGIELTKKSPDAAAFAAKLYDRIRQFGAHAGGFIIASTPLTEGRSCIVTRGKDKALVWDMKTAEKLGFVKLDFLGIDSLSAIKQVGEATKVVWSDIPLNDDQVFQDLSEGRTAGVPQFLTAGQRNFLMMLRPKKFEDLVWANAAFRPGALGQMTPEELAATYNHDPNEIIVYQEDVMEICVKLAGFNWSQADEIRKDIAKSQGIEAMKKWEAPFVEGCKKTIDADEEAAKAFWGKLLNFGRYSFNKAHANSYSWSAYRIAWAKRHHPLQTFAALLNCDENSTAALLDEASDFGVNILPPDPNFSGLEWQIEGDAIRTPLTQVQDVDLRVAKLVIARRQEGGPYKDEADFIARMKKNKIKEKIPMMLFSRKMPDDIFAYPAVAPSLMRTAKQLEDHRKEVKACQQCQLRVYCKAPVPIEFGRTNIMVVGEAPGRDEDRKGKPFQGKSGRLLDELFVKNGVQPTDLTWSNTAACAPPFLQDGESSALTKTQVEELSMKCPWIDKQIQMIKPPLVIAFGRRAWTRMGGQEGIVKANGSIIEKDGVKIMACLHPAFILRDMNKKPEMERTIKRFAKLYKALVPDAPKNPTNRLAEEDPAALARRRAWAIMKRNGR